ncbi:MAG: putative ABC transporter permease subunit [Bacteroidota bacterium]
MHEIILIWRTWALGVRNALLRRRQKNGPRGILAGILAALVFGTLVFRAVMGFLTYACGILRYAPNDEAWRILCLNLATGLALASLLFLLMTAVGTVHAIFLEGGKLAFLLSQPIRPRYVFVAKFAESLAGTIAGLVPFILPSWLALGAVNQAGAGFYLAVCLSLLAGSVIFLCPLALLLLILLRFVPRQRARQVAVTLSLLAGLGLVFGVQYLNALVVRSGAGSPAWLAEIKPWQVGGVAYLPHVWMARAPLAALGWPGLRLSQTAVPLAVTMVVVFACTVALAGRIYLAGWSNGQDEEPRRLFPPVSIPRRFLARLTGPFYGILRKDLLMARREPLLWYILAASSIVVGFFIWNLSTLGWPTAPASSWRETFYACLVVLCTAGWNAQIGGVLISREGGCWWVTQASPQRAEAIFGAKLAFALVPQLIFVFLANLSLAVFAGIRDFNLWRSTFTSAALSAGLAGLSLLLDVLVPNFHLRLDGKWSGGRNAGLAKLALTSCLGLMVVLIMGFSLALPHYHRSLPFVGRLDAGLARFIAAGVFLLETLVLLGVSWAVGVARLKKLMTEPG